MKKRTAFIGAILSLIPLGQPLLIKTGVVLSSSATFLTVPKSIFAIQKQTDFLMNPATHKKIFLGNHKTKISKFEIIKKDPNLIANMQSEFNNSSGRSWENAQFERKTKNSYSRTYLTEDGTYYTVYEKGGYWSKGSGILGKVTSHTHNTCYFGTTAACLSNIVTTYYELYIEDKKLVEYYKTGKNGEPNKAIIGTLRPGFSISSNSNVILSLPEKVNANSADFYVKRGIEKFDSGNYYGAISDINKAIEINPNNAKAYIIRGWNKGKLKDYYGAISDYTKAIEINPNLSMAYSSRGNYKRKLKDYYGAISDYTKAIEINPIDDDAYYHRGMAKDELKDYYGAISDYTKAIEINPIEADVYNNRGNVKVALKDYYGAISDYTKAIEMNPNYSKAYSNRGITKKAMGDIQGACSDWEKASSLGNDTAAKLVRDKC